MNRQPSAANPQLQAPNHDVLYLAWYEVGRTRLRRRTEQGFEVDCKRGYGQCFQDGERLRTTANTEALVHINPCVCICLNEADLPTIGSFCYDVGNRHLPIFAFEDGIAVAYDARLYEALRLKYGSKISLQDKVLSPSSKINSPRAATTKA